MSPDKYKSIGNGFSVTIKEDGVRGLAKGWAPTFIGYSMQGLCKFGFYEVFKIFYSDLLGEVRAAAEHKVVGAARGSDIDTLGGEGTGGQRVGLGSPQGGSQLSD